MSGPSAWGGPPPPSPGTADNQFSGVTVLSPCDAWAVGFDQNIGGLDQTLIENWDVLGLRATGSIDYRTTNVFVPEAYTHFAVTESPKRGGALYTIGIAGFAVICHSGWACGIGRRLLDELSEKVRSGITGWAGPSVLPTRARASPLATP